MIDRERIMRRLREHRNPGRLGACVLLAVALSACGPVEGGQPGMSDVETHLDFELGYLPEDCDPFGLYGDGRGTMTGVTFECADGDTLQIERFDQDIRDDELPGAPAESKPGEVEWRDLSTGDVVSVRSGDMPGETLMRVAGSIQLRG